MIVALTVEFVLLVFFLPLDTKNLSGPPSIHGTDQQNSRNAKQKGILHLGLRWRCWPLPRRSTSYLDIGTTFLLPYKLYTEDSRIGTNTELLLITFPQMFFFHFPEEGERRRRRQIKGHEKHVAGDTLKLSEYEYPWKRTAVPSCSSYDTGAFGIVSTLSENWIKQTNGNSNEFVYESWRTFTFSYIYK
jgi:hypothetical protein